MKNLALIIRNGARAHVSFIRNLCLLAVALILSTGKALAVDADLLTAATGELSTLKTGVISILAVMITIVGVLVLYKWINKAMHR
jgi:hypothetical protein